MQTPSVTTDMTTGASAPLMGESIPGGGAGMRTYVGKINWTGTRRLIAAAGVSEAASAGVATGKYVRIVNNSDAAMYVFIGAAATILDETIPAGGEFSSPHPMVNSVNVICGTISKPYVVYEGVVA